MQWRSFRLAVLLLLLVALSSTVRSQAGAWETLVITNGRLIEGTGAVPTAEGRIVIRGKYISAVGPSPTVRIPAGARVVDANGGTILPGIINAHVHNSGWPQTRRRFLLAGVTSTCDLGHALHDMPLYKREETADQRPAARGLQAGPILTALGGYPSTHGLHWDYQIASAKEATTAVKRVLDAGADMIKIALEPGIPGSEDQFPVLTTELAQTIVATAHAHGVPVRAHVQQAAFLDSALQADVDAIEHVPLPFSEAVMLRKLEGLQWTQSEPLQPLSLDHFPQFEDQLIRMASQNVVLVPTLSVGTCGTHGLVQFETEARRIVCTFQLEVVGQYHELGGTIALGNDYGNPGVERGMPLREMQLLLAAGLSPSDVIQAGTRHAAQVCGRGHDLGTLEPGRLADVIVVKGNPLQDITAMERIGLVLKDGRIAHLPSR